MRVAWLTDLHLDGLEESEVDTFCEKLAACGVDCALVGGDVGESDTLGGYLGRIQKALGAPVYFVLGNHDHFGTSVKRARGRAREIGERCENLHWLPTAHGVALTDSIGLVGHGAFMDGRIGNWEDSTYPFKDPSRIEDLPEEDREALRLRLGELGEEAAEEIGCQLERALVRYSEIWILMHVPPFREACWHDDLEPEQADQWLPFFTCGAAGEVIRKVARRHPDHTFRVLCGHTHGRREAQIEPNLQVLTGASEPGNPAVERIFELE